MAKDKTHPHVLFKRRLEREGRMKDFTALTKKLMAEEDLYFRAAEQKALKQMGYKGPEGERKLAAAWKKDEHRTAVERERNAAREEANEERRIEDFEEALATLPPTSSIQVEMDWVGSHPAMFRKFKQRDPTKSVDVDANDVLYSAVGKAPSRRAVNRLYYFANSPGKYFDPLMSEDKKKSEDSTGGDGEQLDVGIEEVRKQLARVKGRTK